MAEFQDLTLSALLDLVEAELRRAAPGRTAIPARAFAADGRGAVTTIGFPAPVDDADERALSAVLGVELEKRGAVACVLALERPAAAAGSCLRGRVVLEGVALTGARRREVRVVEVRRLGDRIEGLDRVTGGAAPDADGDRVGAARSTSGSVTLGPVAARRTARRPV